MYGPKKLYKCFVKGTQEVPLRASPTTTTGPGATEGVLKGGLTFERLAEEDDAEQRREQDTPPRLIAVT